MLAWTRWIVLAGLSTLVACGGGGSSGTNEGPEDGGTFSSADFDITSTGSEPRVTLGVGEARTLLSIEATAFQSIDLAGTVTEDSVSASLELVAEFVPNETTRAELNLIPILRSYSPVSDVEGEVVPGAWDRSYDRNGVLLGARSTDRNGVFGLQSLDIFLIPALVLAAPEVPVGAGATWISESPLQTGLVRTTTRLIAVNETGLQVEINAQFVSNDESVSASHDTTILALYDRESLLIRSGEVDSVANFSGIVNRNGSDTAFSRMQTHRHVFTEVQ